MNFLDIPFMIEIFPRLLRAAGTTLQISIVSLLIGLAVGIILGVLRVYGNRPIKSLIKLLVIIVRGSPAALQVYAVYFLFPRAFGFRPPLFWLGVIALVVNTSGYQVEIVRASLESISKNQTEAATAIGMTKWQTMLFVTLPQSLKRMVGPMTNEFANLIKISSALMLIALYELTKAGQAITVSTYMFAEVWIIVALLYFGIIKILLKISSYLENNVFSFGDSSKVRGSILD